MTPITWTDEAIINEVALRLPNYIVTEISREPYKSPTIFLICDNGHQYKTTLGNLIQRNNKCIYCTGRHKFTIDQVRQYVEVEIVKWHKLKLISDYKNNSTPISLIDDDGYKYYVRLSNLQIQVQRKNSKLEKFHRFNIYTLENIHNYLKINNIQDKLLSTEYHNNHEYLQWLCPNGHMYNMNWANFSQGKRCHECAPNARPSFEFISKQFDNRGLILLSTDYVNNIAPLDFICKNHLDHGVQHITWATVQSSTAYGCVYCHYNRLRRDRQMGIQEFKKRVYQMVGGEYQVVGSKYINNSTPIEMYHSTCGHTYKVQPGLFLVGRRCAYCYQSKGEMQIATILTNSKIIFITQHTFDDCKYQQKLRFDFYIPSYNTCIEYQGIQHYQPIDFANKGEQWAKNEYKKNQIRDQIKRQYCKKHNINLIEIPYWEFDNIEDIIQNKCACLS